MVEVSKKVMLRITEVLEIVLAAFMVMVLVLVICRTIAFETPKIWTESASIHHFLEGSLTIAIAIEFVKMLSLHTPGTLIEVLLFALARHMLVESLTPLQTLFMIICICILFAARKYLLTTHDQKGMNEHTNGTHGIMKDLVRIREEMPGASGAAKEDAAKKNPQAAKESRKKA